MRAKSPSTRRAWIEIRPDFRHANRGFDVALHPEGVDRNLPFASGASPWRGRPPPGGRG